MSSRKPVLKSDLYTWDYFQNDDVCRLCWSEDAHRVITVKSSENDKSTKNLLAEKIEDCFSLDLSNEGAPKQVCSKCCDIVENFYDFKRFCLKADRKLKEILNNHVLETPNDAPEYAFDVELEIKNDYSDTEKSHSNADYCLKEYVTLLIDDRDQLQKIRKRTKYSLKRKPDCSDTDTDSKILPKEGQIQEIKREVSSSPNRKCNNLDTGSLDSNIKDSLQECLNVTPLKHSQIQKIRKETKDIDTSESKYADTDTSDINIEDGLLEYLNLTQLTEDQNGKRKDPNYSSTFCYICRAELKTLEKLIEHNLELHGIERNGQFKCFGCDKRFKNRKNRLGHEINFCKGLKEGYKCGVCGRFLPKRRTYEIHMKAHRSNKPVSLPEEIFKCGKCYKLFKTKKNLSEHKKVHEIKEEFVCEACGRCFNRRDYLSKHRLTHQNSRQHACPHCDYKAVQRASLLVHLRKHTGERPFGCDLCPQRCVSSGNLRAHRLRHLGVKQFQCTICSKKFGYKDTLQEHIRVTHERDLQSHTCQQCGAIYSRRRGLRRHVEAKHGKPKEKPPAKTDGASSKEFVLVTNAECR